MLLHNSRTNEKDVLGEVNGHKVILGTFSSVFKTQFFGSMKETNKDIVNVEETTFDAFNNYAGHSSDKLGKFVFFTIGKS